MAASPAAIRRGERPRAEAAPRAAGGIGGVVDEARRAIARDEGIDQRTRRPRGLAIPRAIGRAIAPGPPPYPALQHPPQILGRTGVAFEVAQRPFFEERAVDRRWLALAGRLDVDRIRRTTFRADDRIVRYEGARENLPRPSGCHWR